MFVSQLDSITLARFFDLFHHAFNMSYAEIAETLHYSERTIQRWRTIGVAYGLEKSDFHDLFKLLEQQCKVFDQDPKYVLCHYFELANTYEKGSYDDVKRLIINNLKNKSDNLKTFSPLDSINQPKVQLRPVEFISSCLNKGKAIQCIYMSFHSGWDWLKSHEKHQLLETIHKLQINLHILSNDSNTIQKIADTMASSEKQKFYVGYNLVINQWQNCAMQFNNMQARISNLPIMRKMYIVVYKDQTYELLGREYVYNFRPFTDEEPFFYLTHLDQKATNYFNEYEFLWKNSKTYDTWKHENPVESKKLYPEDYLILYPRHRTQDLPIEKRFVISKLSIHDDNKVTLKTNIASSLDIPLKINPAEYEYKGSAHITDYTIFMNLHDCTNNEQVNISIVKPLHPRDRYIGIMNALSPRGTPISIKIACIKQDEINLFNFEKLLSLLQCHNQYWDDHLMIVEEEDSNAFYSTEILCT